MSTKPFFDIIAIIPLEEELLAFLDVFPSIEDLTDSGQLTHAVDTGTPGLSMLVTQQKDMGRQHATNAAIKVLQTYDTNLLLCLGIAGGLSDDLKLGDVCYTGDLTDVNDNSRAVDNGSTYDVQFSPTYYQTNPNISSMLNFIRTQPSLRKIYTAWMQERQNVATGIGPVIARDGTEETLGAPTSKFGNIVCGDVNKSDHYTRQLKSMNRRVLAIETEAGAIFSVAQEKGISAISIRGISDYADGNKGKLEAMTKGKVRNLAASNAVSFLKLQFQNHYFVQKLQEKRQIDQLILPVSPSPADLLQTSLEKARKQIDAAMQELSPEYHLQPKGYRIPVPRLRATTKIENTANPIPARPIDVLDVLKSSAAAIISLDRSYPDQSLPYVIAHSLLSEELGNKQIIPVVVDGELIRLPQGNFTAITELPLSDLDVLEGAQLVLIISSPPIASPTKRKFMLDQIKSLKSSKTLIISRDEASLAAESELATSLSADIFRVCRISFLEMTHFVEKNFNMNAPEAGVIAKRLNDTFNQFNLSAHPSYFVGISKEVLVTLLHANHRSELIQLAVDGFLLFLVADDKAKHKLARTTRAEFLRKLVFAMRVEHREFTQTALVDYTSMFAKANDFNIDPIGFIQDFIDHGILHFHNATLRFSLPFMEAYLLAVELKENTEAAIKYFDPHKEDFDFPTFDLYAEQKPDSGVVAHIGALVKDTIQQLTPPETRKHVLLGDELQPAIIKDLVRLNSLQASLEDAKKDVGTGKNHNKRKQKLLDIQEQVQEAASERARQETPTASEEEPEEIKKLNQAIRVWLAGTILLGAGAERLDASAKRNLARDQITLASSIIDEWTRHAAAFDIKGLKDDLTSDESISSIQAHLKDGQDVNETRKLVGSLVDLMEYSVLAHPFIRLMGILCEYARRSVLAESIVHTSVEGDVPNLIKGMWAADIDASQGKKLLGDAIKSLPYAPFLRITLASHCLTRVFWSHWSTENRHLLLEMATTAIQPLAQIDKGRLARMIENDTMPDPSTNEENPQEAA